MTKNSILLLLYKACKPAKALPADFKIDSAVNKHSNSGSEKLY